MALAGGRCSCGGRTVGVWLLFWPRRLGGEAAPSGGKSAASNSTGDSSFCTPQERSEYERKLQGGNCSAMTGIDEGVGSHSRSDSCAARQVHWYVIAVR